MVFSSTHNLSQAQFENLLYGFGSPNYGTQRSLCFNAMVTAFSADLRHRGAEPELR